MEKRYDAKLYEPMMQALWREKAAFAYQPQGKGPVYSIDTPPPTVSGALHIGHVFSYTQAEIAARYKRMRGYSVFYPFGFDDNGLPTERLVEKEIGRSFKDMPRSAFVQQCYAILDKYEGAFRALWETMGFSVDWERAYRTIGEDVQAISQRSFLELVNMGKAYRKQSPVLWCTHCQTSIAQAEIETQQVPTSFNTISFGVNGAALNIATTRPEMLYGCVGVLVHPDDLRYKHLIGKQARVPLYGHAVPILADELAAMDKGTGAVMCCTYGDTTDVLWCEKHALPYREVLTANGHIAGGIPLIGALTIDEAREVILQQLAAQGLLGAQQDMTHQIGVHERCQTPVQILPSPQWYIDILTEKQRFLQAADALNWYPPTMKRRYTDWVEGLKWDWCISRQRYFGIPFPVWYCADCGQAHFASIDSLPVNPMETPYKGTCRCGCKTFCPETAVMDTWATSSLTPLINARWGLEGDCSETLIPMGMRAQAHEIIRTWTFYTIVKSLYHTRKLPWKDVMISGFVLEAPGRKISKSKGSDSATPMDMITKHSADVLRYWTAEARLGTDTYFSEQGLAGAQKFITKLWNCARFCFMHLQDFDPKSPVTLLPLDAWLLSRVAQARQSAMRHMDAYEMGLARKEIDEVFFSDFCDYYLEIAKERLYQPDKHGAAQRQSGQHALYNALVSILEMYASITPHVTEAIYQSYFAAQEHTKLLALRQWDTKDCGDETLLAFGEMIKAGIGTVRKYKSENNLSMKATLETATFENAKAFEEWMRLTDMDLRACTSAAQIVLT